LNPPAFEVPIWKSTDKKFPKLVRRPGGLVTGPQLQASQLLTVRTEYESYCTIRVLGVSQGRWSGQSLDSKPWRSPRDFTAGGPPGVDFTTKRWLRAYAEGEVARPWANPIYSNNHLELRASRELASNPQVHRYHPHPLRNAGAMERHKPIIISAFSIRASLLRSRGDIPEIHQLRSLTCE
jgi:hypothetical protein